MAPDISIDLESARWKELLRYVVVGETVIRLKVAKFSQHTRGDAVAEAWQTNKEKPERA